MEAKIQFAQNLKLIRKRCGLSRRELALRVGYTDKAVEKWESGHSFPPLPVICRIAEELGVRLEELVYDRRSEIRYFLGIDGGGTKTAFRLENAAGILVSECRLGSSNPNNVGMERCAEILRSGIMEVTAGVDLREVAVFAGLAGGISESNYVGIRRTLTQLGFGFVDNGSDMDNALEMCLRGRNGVTVIAGTGGIAFAQKNGKQYRVGGWGYLIDSGGSGYNLGRDALDAAFRSMDGRGGKTLLTELLEARLKKSLDQAIPELYGGGKQIIASLAQEVFRACDAEDLVAVGILRKNCAYLAEMIRTALRYVDDPAPLVVICGGLANRADLLEVYIREYLGENCDLRFCKDPIATGAVMCARRRFEQFGNMQ